VLLILAIAATVVQGQYLETTIPVGAMPAYILWNPTSSKVYVSNSNDNTVTIIDGATNQVLVTRAVPSYPGALVWNSVANRVYCLCSDGNRVAVIDGASDVVIERIRVPENPVRAVYNPTQNKLYVACVGDADTIAVIDGSTDSLVTVIAPRYVGALLCGPVSNRVLCVCSDSVLAIDCQTDSVVSRVFVNTGYWGWCYNPLDGLAYLCGNRGTQILAPTGDSVVGFVPGYNCPEPCVVPLPNKLYLSHWDDRSQIGVLDCGSVEVTESIAVWAGPMVFDSAHARVYVSSSAGLYPWVTVIDARADSVVETIVCDGWLGALCWNAAYSRAYVINCRDDLLYVIRDTTTGIAEKRGTVGAVRRQFCSTVGRMLEWRGAASAALVDAGGRKVATVVPGRNDVGRLPVGVYSVVGARGVTSRFVKVR